MATTTTNTVNLELGYADNTERTYKIPFSTEYTTENIDEMKQRIRSFNTAAADANSAVSQTFLSKRGSRTIGVLNATFVQATEEVIYNG